MAGQPKQLYFLTDKKTGQKIYFNTPNEAQRYKERRQRMTAQPDQLKRTADSLRVIDLQERINQRRQPKLPKETTAYQRNRDYIANLENKETRGIATPEDRAALVRYREGKSRATKAPEDKEAGWLKEIGTLQRSVMGTTLAPGAGGFMEGTRVSTLTKPQQASYGQRIKSLQDSVFFNAEAQRAKQSGIDLNGGELNRRYRTGKQKAIEVLRQLKGQNLPPEQIKEVLDKELEPLGFNYDYLLYLNKRGANANPQTTQ